MNQQRNQVTWKLRWQLTFRFAGVTMAVLIIIIALVSSFFFYRILIFNWRLSPESWIEVAKHSAVPATRRILVNSPNNKELIQMWLSFVGNPVSFHRLFKIGHIDVTLRTTNTVSSVLLDGLSGLFLLYYWW